MCRRGIRSFGGLATLTTMLVMGLGTASAQASFLGGGIHGSLVTTNGGIALAYTANMDANQMTAAGTPGEPGASGTAHLSLDGSTGQICYNISWTGIPDGVTFGHIHQAVYGQPENPGFTVNLFGPDSNGAPNPSSGCVLAPAEVQAIEAAPSDYIVVLHSPNYPVGAIRGQIQPG